MIDRNNKELAEQLVENIYAFGVDANIIERTLNTATNAELEQLRAENEKLKKELVTLRDYNAVTAWNIGMDIHIKSKGLLQDAREVGSKIAASIRKKEPDNDE